MIFLHAGDTRNFMDPSFYQRRVMQHFFYMIYGIKVVYYYPQLCNV